MESKTIRLNNLIALASKYRRVVEFCERIGMQPSYFSQLKSERKSVGDDLARKIEEKLGLQRGYLDVQHNEKDDAPAPPASDALGVAYSIEAMPEPLREQFKKLVYQVAAYCSEKPVGVTSDVQPFIVTGKEDAAHECNPISATGKM